MKCRYCSLRVDGNLLIHYRTCPGVDQLGYPRGSRKAKPKRDTTLCNICRTRPRTEKDYYCRECKNEKARERWRRVKNVKWTRKATA